MSGTGANFAPPYNSTTNLFMARYTGRFLAPSNGVYYFDTGSDDGSCLYLDGTLVVSNNYAQA